MARLLRSFGLLLATALACRPATPSPDASPSTPARAIVISLDAFNEARVAGTMSAAHLPAIHALFGQGACAASARPAFPSVTAAGHAAIWTGAYGHESGIPANTHLRLPASQYTILETHNGFRSTGLRREPMWITAAHEGRRVVAHHVTQAPQRPGYPTDDRERGDSFATAIVRAERALASERLAVLNGYNHVFLWPTFIEAGDVEWRPLAAPWPGDPGARGADLLEAEVPLASDSLARGRALHLLLRLWPEPRGDSAQLFAAFGRDFGAAVRVMPHAEEQAPLRGRPLARWFSPPAALRLDDGRRASMRLRLFALSARDTSLALFLPGLHLSDANRPDLASAYDSVVGGWVGNSAVSLWEQGRLGPTLVDGGDGRAERRWLESAELLTRTTLEGAAWGWRRYDPALLLDYFPLGDDADHALWGYLAAHRPGYDPSLAVRLTAVRTQLWELVDLRLGALMTLARGAPGTRLFVTGDHGMRAVWRRFRPNVALQQAGLQGVDGGGRIDLSRSRAASVNGYWVSVNVLARRQGIVAPADEDRVLDAIREALLAVRDERGLPVVTRVFDRREAGVSALGMGGAAGGDVYYEVADGTLWSAETTGPVVEPYATPRGAHGFPPTAADMQTVFCQWWPGAGGARRAPAALLTDVAPTVQRWLGVVRP